MTNYYDYILGGIPLTLLGISGGLWLLGLSLPMAVPLAAAVAAALVGHALFVNGPVSETTVDNSASGSAEAFGMNSD
ncbi:MAG: hypothetical protein J07HQX50_00378 [Haloquadratum sp. J07HQX50]|jgi:hypothetical protein|nr:MAG: hypothetical protein J07HQX50_00378 [Haloquadratum sp. J07HQX50]